MSSRRPLFIQVFTNKRIAVTLFLMFASSLPLALTSGGTTFQLWLTNEGVDIKTISLLALVGLPYNLKIFWAPLLDRFIPPFLNRRTGWIAIFEVCLILSIGTIGFFHPSKQINIVVIFATAIAFFSASQDIVIDAYRVDLLRPEERGAGASMVNIGGRIAIMTSGAIAPILSDHMPWSSVYMVMAAGMSIGLITCFLAPAPEVSVAPPRTLADAVVKPFMNFFERRGAVAILLFVLFFKLGDAFAVALMTNFLSKGLGFSNTDIGAVFKVVSTIGFFVGSFIGGAGVAVMGVYRSLWVFGIIAAVSNFSFAGLAMHGKSYAWMVTAIGTESFCGSMSTIAFVAYLISLCDARFSATQYALLTSIMAVPRTLLVTRAGAMVSVLGWTNYFLMVPFFAVPGLALLAWIRRLEPPKPVKAQSVTV